MTAPIAMSPLRSSGKANDMWPLYAMDTSFYSEQGSYGLKTRCAMLAELGFDATYLSLWNDVAWKDLEDLTEVAKANDLGVAGVYATLDISRSESAGANGKLLQSAPSLSGVRQLELAVQMSDLPDARYDEMSAQPARELIERLLSLLPDDVEINLYPHIGMWLERFDQAVDLCKKLDDPRLGVVFPSFHWYALKGEPVDTLFARAGKSLKVVNICGTRRTDSGRPTIEPLDDGELDNFAVLGSLMRAEYQGMVGIQGYSIGGDVYARLQRSIAAYRRMTERLQAHPDWAVLRPDLAP
jgi:sugar phosphate isomerase/epimerase